MIMARQNTAPVMFNRTVRPDDVTLMSSGRAGVVQMLGYVPLFAGDSCSGQVGIDLELKDMPRPLRNAVYLRAQAWFVPKSSHPQFSGADELYHSMAGKPIKAYLSSDRTPPAFHNLVPAGSKAAVAATEFYKALGVHIDTTQPLHSDLPDAFTIVYNTMSRSWSLLES